MTFMDMDSFDDFFILCWILMCFIFSVNLFIFYFLSVVVKCFFEMKTKFVIKKNKKLEDIKINVCLE